MASQRGNSNPNKKFEVRKLSNLKVLETESLDVAAARICESKASEMGIESDKPAEQSFQLRVPHATRLVANSCPAETAASLTPIEG